jgi:hypothetical protein
MGSLRKIRLIVDEGEVECPICAMDIKAGYGHECREEEVGTTGQTFHIPSDSMPMRGRTGWAR